MVALFFLCKNIITRRIDNVKEEILEKIFAHPEMQKIPIGCQSTAVTVFTEIIRDIVEENLDGKLSDLLSE